jgi:hypothetical protein
VTEEQQKLAADAAQRLRQIAEKNTDPEAGHSEADGILCELLTSLGMQEVVDAYKAIEPKWYA